MNDELYEKIRRFQHGNDYVFTEIYLCTYNLVYRCTFQMLKNENDTNDIVQIVYLKIYRKINTLDDVTKFKSWLLSIVYNESKNFLKSQQRNCKYIDTSFDISEEADTLDICDDTPDSEEQCLINETNDIIKSLIELLPEEQKQVLMLYYFEEKDISEISKILSLPSGTVKSRLNYARKKLKKSIEAYESRNEVRLHSGILGFLNAQYMSSLRNITMMFKTATTAAPIMLSAATLSVSAVSTPFFTKPAEKVTAKLSEPKEIIQSVDMTDDEFYIPDTDKHSDYEIIVTVPTEKPTEVHVTTVYKQSVQTTVSAVTISTTVPQTAAAAVTTCATTVKTAVSETKSETEPIYHEEPTDTEFPINTERPYHDRDDIYMHPDNIFENKDGYKDEHKEKYPPHTEMYENRYNNKKTDDLALKTDDHTEIIY